MRPVIPNALDLVDAIARAPFWEEARAGGEVHTEVPFAVRVEKGESFGSLGAVEVPTILHGVIDLVYPRRGRLADPRLQDRPRCRRGRVARRAARPQLAQYRAAWERITGEKVAGQGIVALRTGAVEWA